MTHLTNCEFYITNVCNFNCDNCNRFNNHYFTGQQLWKDYADVYAKWAKSVTFDWIAILGGEPLLNPSINEWIDGIATLWPDSLILVPTNGTHLNRVKGLYDTVKKHKDRVHFELSLHNASQEEEMLNEIKEFLGDSLEFKYLQNPAVYYGNDKTFWEYSYDNIKAESWPDCVAPEDFDKLPTLVQFECRYKHHVAPDLLLSTLITDSNGVKVEFAKGYLYTNTSLLENNGIFSIHDSDPEKALDVCTAKKCHHFSKGKFYKCLIPSLLPEFYKQFHFDISDDDVELMHSYRPLTVDHTTAELEEFCKNLINVDPIPQCKFCPESFAFNEIKAGTNKIRVKKKKP